MLCYICQKEIDPESLSVRLDSDHVRHCKCSPMSRNFKKAFPKAWTNKYVEKEEIEPIKYKRLLRLKGENK